MSPESIISIALTVLSVLIAPIIYLGRSQMQRLDRVEQESARKLDEAQVRQIIEDKVHPISEDTREIKASIDRLLTHVLQLKK